LSGSSLTKVFFDSDTVIAGSASRKGASFILLQLAELNLIQGFTSQQVIDECRKNLQLKLPDAIPQFEQIISHAVTIVENPSLKQITQYDRMAHKKDVPILTAAIKLKVQFFVTFNTQDFFPPPEIGLHIVKPGDLLQRIRRKLSQVSEE